MIDNKLPADTPVFIRLTEFVKSTLTVYYYLPITVAVSKLQKRISQTGLYCRSALRLYMVCSNH